MAEANMKMVIQSDVQRVWDVVTEVENYTWRSDLERTQLLNERQFVEYTKEGYKTTFTITASEPCRRWEFDMENDNMKGHWTGIFTQKGDRTELDFKETVTAKKALMKPFVKSYLKKQQAQFAADLKKALQ